MHMEEIEYIIKPSGETEIRAKGIKGPDCEKLTESVRGKLGEVTAHEHTAEFFEVSQTETQQQRA